MSPLPIALQGTKTRLLLLCALGALLPAMQARAQSFADASGAALPNAPEPGQTTQGKTAAAATPPPQPFPDFAHRRKEYLYELLGPGVFISTLVQATVDDTHPLNVGYPPDGFAGPGEHPAHGIVPEWGEGAQGFGKRYGSRFGMGLIGTTTRFGLGEALHEDVAYHRCECTGFLPRSFHAVTQSLVAHTPSGRGVFSVPALVSPFIAAEVATYTWYPNRFNSSDAFRTSTSLYYGLPIKNLVKEFTGR